MCKIIFGRIPGGLIFHEGEKDRHQDRDAAVFVHEVSAPLETQFANIDLVWVEPGGLGLEGRHRGY